MDLSAAVQAAAEQLQRTRRRVVFAESCTAGLVSAELATVPGISEFHCGSFVTYRNRSKQDWLGVSASLLHAPGPVSEQVARQMATGALARTTEANLALSVTGHLGPHAPQPLDGLVFIGIARRADDDGAPHTWVRRHQLTSSARDQRQAEAAASVLSELVGALTASGDPG